MNPCHIAFKICAYTYVAFFAWLLWLVLPLKGHWPTINSMEPLYYKTMVESDMTRYFETFAGSAECEISASDLYELKGTTATSRSSFCTTRKELLRSMSEGGRVGFDAPYIPRTCNYRWFDVSEICMILERFDGVVFIRDESLQPIYSAFNMLLRQNLIHGSLQTWTMNAQHLNECQCKNQFLRQPCTQKAITSSEQMIRINKNGNRNRRTESENQNTTYKCPHIPPHAFLDIRSAILSSSSSSSSPQLSQATIQEFQNLAPKRPSSHYKHIPVITSISPTTATIQTASKAIQSLIKLADETGRKTDMIFLGPNAPTHIDIDINTKTKIRKNFNQEIWNYHHTMSKLSFDNDIDFLGMWNLTIQANTGDGVKFGPDVAIVQVMMVVNWLSRLETS